MYVQPTVYNKIMRPWNFNDNKPNQNNETPSHTHTAVVGCSVTVCQKQMMMPCHTGTHQNNMYKKRQRETKPNKQQQQQQ